MTVETRRIVFWGTLVAIVLLGLVFAFRPRAVIVDMATVDRGELVITVNDEGETRVHDIYVLSAPVAGHMRRIDLHAGDPVVALESIVAEIQPIDAAFLDPRTEAQARADVRAAESAKKLAEAEVEQARAVNTSTLVNRWDFALYLLFGNPEPEEEDDVAFPGPDLRARSRS